MSIKRDVALTINGSRAILDSNIYVYMNDRGIDLRIKIYNLEYIVESSFTPIRASATVLKPNNKDSFTIDDLDIDGDRILFYIERNMIDEISEVGTYKVQLHLYDDFDNRVTIPPFKFYVKPVIAESDGGTSGGGGTSGKDNSISVNGEIYLANRDGLITLPDYPTIPTKVSSFENDSRYVTDTELENKSYATKTYVDTSLDGHSFKFLTQAEYDSITPEPNVVYYITDASETSAFITMTDVNEAIGTALDGHTFKFLTQAEYDLLTDEEKKDTSVVYYIIDKADGGLTEDQLQKLQKAYEHSQTAHAPANAEENVQSDWNETNTNSDAFIKNKPKIPTNTSQLTNDSGFLTDIPSEYVTDTELEGKSYATETYVNNKLDGRSFKFLTQADYDILTEDEKNDTSVVYYITDEAEEGLTEDQLIQLQIAYEHSQSAHAPVDAEKNVQSNWNETDTNSDAFIKNKPTIPTKTSELTNDADFATKTYVSTKIAEASLSGGNVDLADYAKITDIPTKTSQLTNDSGFITAIPEEYVTETELNSKGYLTNIPSEYVTETELNSKGYATENYVNNKLDGHSFRFLTKAEYDNLPENERNNPLIEYHITDKADGGLTEDQLQQLQTAFNHSQTAHAPVNAEENVQSDWSETNTNSDAFIKNKPKIPTKTSELTNDSSLATESFVTTKIAEASLSGGEVDLSAYQLKSDTSLTTSNNTIVGAINEVNSSLSTKVGTSEVNSAINSYVTEHKAELKGEKGDKGDKGDAGNDGLTTNIVVNGNTYNHVNGTITLPNYPTVPTKTSQLTNDSGYLTSVPNEYVTETELNSKGFSKIWSGTQSAYDALTDKTLYDYYFIEE